MANDLPDESISSRSGRAFRTTHWSVVALAGQADTPEAATALELLCRTYWYPLFAYVRHRGYDLHQAEDLTQSFFSRLLSKSYLADADRERGRFRTFLLAAMNHFLANEWNRDQAQKRGGGCEFISLEYVREQGERAIDPGHQVTPEKLYEQRWAETVLAKVIERLRQEYDGSSVKRFDALKPFLTEERGATSYANAARSLGLSEQAVKSAVHRLRQRWRELMREEIAHTLKTASAEEIDDEIRYLIQVLE